MTIDTSSLDTLRSSLTGALLLPGDDGYLQASTVAIAEGAPALVVLPENAADVAVAVAYAGAEGLLLSVRSGGHSAAGHGTNTGGLVINLSRMDTVRVVAESGLVQVGGGALWGDIAAALAPHGLAISSGDTTSVGVGGLTLGGGIGWLVRRDGLALDNLVSAQVVTAGGDILTASAETNPELFWALRGGGGNFGVVTSFTFQAQPLTTVTGGSISFGLDTLEATLIGWRDVMRAAPDELCTTLLAMPGFGDFPAGVQVLVCYSGDEDAAADAIEPLLSLPGMLSHNLKRMPYADLLEQAHPPAGPLILVDNNGFCADFSDTAIRELVAVDRSLEASVLMVRSLGGAFSRVEPDATAFAHRDSEVLVMSVAFLPDTAGDDELRSVRERWTRVAPHLTGTYANFRTAADERVAAQMYPPATHRRLAAAKFRYDPGNLFSQNLNILPVAAGDVSD